MAKLVLACIGILEIPIQKYIAEQEQFTYLFKLLDTRQGLCEITIISLDAF
jgi:hypothetical protein